MISDTHGPEKGPHTDAGIGEKWLQVAADALSQYPIQISTEERQFFFDHQELLWRWLIENAPSDVLVLMRIYQMISNNAICSLRDSYMVFNGIRQPPQETPNGSTPSKN